MTSTPPEPNPDNTPDLEPGGGVKPGSTPPDAPQTSGLSEPEPATVKRFPGTGIAAMVSVALVVIVFVIAAVAILA